MSRRKKADVELAALTMRRLLAEVRRKPAAELPTIHEALEFRREQYGLTQREFARLLGMGHTHYSEFANGKRQLPRKAMGNAYRIGVPADVLLARAQSVRQR